MASPPFSNSEDTFNTSSAHTTRDPQVAPHPGPRFADFQFRTIGQQPELLKRISAPNPDTEYSYDHDSGRLSPLSPDRSIQSLPLPENDSAKRPSLRDRLSLLEPPATKRHDNVDVTMEDPPEIRPDVEPRSTQNIDLLPSTIQTHGRHPDNSSSEGPPANLRTTFPQNRRLGKEPDLSQGTAIQEQAIRTTTEQSAVSASDESPFPIITSSSETQTRLSPPPAQISSHTSGTDGVSTPFPSGEDVYSLTALRTLQSRLSSSLSNFNPISTANALAAAQSAKDQCTEILATAHHAHTLAQQASLLAQESMGAAQECLDVAATIQNRADLALSEVEKIRSSQGISSGGEWEYNATVKALEDDLCELAEWVRRRDAYESKYLRQFEEEKIEKCKKKLALQLERGSNTFSSDKPSHNLNAQGESSSMQTSIHAGVMTVEDEADAATRAWNQHCEQSAERKRLAEEELRKRREAELELERQRLQAQSEVDAREAELEKLRAERLKAEEEEKARQEKEALESQRQQQELEIARFLRSQKQARDNMAKFAAEEKKKAQTAQVEREARLIAGHEQKRRELHKMEMLKRQEIEKAKALLAESQAKQREKVISERMKRLAVKAQQPPVSADTVANILDKAKEKQSMATLTIDNHTPPSQYAPLPSPPMHQASAPSSFNHAEFGNVVSTKTLLNSSPQTSKQQNRTLSGGIKLDESSNSVNLPLSTSKSSTSLQKGAKSHESTPTMPSSTDKLLSDNSAFGMPSSHIVEVDRMSVDGVSHGPLKSSSSSPLTPLSAENSSLPVIMPRVHIPNASVTSSNDLQDVYTDISIHSDGHDAGNLPVVPPSRILPVSAEAQRANLWPFMDANRISYEPGASDVLSSSADQPSATEMSLCKPLSSSQMNGDQMDRTSSASKPESEKMPKLEPLNDVPVLSMPSPPVATIDIMPTSAAQLVESKPKLPDFKKIKRVPSMTTLETSLSSNEHSASPQSMPSSEPPLEPALTQLNGPSIANSSIVSKEKVRPAAVRRNVPPLANSEQASLANTTNQGFQASDLHRSVSPRMGPDAAAVTDGWAPQLITMADDPMAERPRKQLPRNRLSPPLRAPSSGSQIRLPPLRPRAPPRSDHYSPPRRIPDPLPSPDNDHSRDRRRDGGIEYTREYNEDRRSLSPEDMSSTGRKRYRDDDSVDAPPPRRYRYDSPPFRQDDYDQLSTSSYQHRTTNYGRSPSPEPRRTPLALRLESEKPSWSSHGGSSYRPTYNDSNSYAYDPQSRNIKNHRYFAPHSQSIPQGPSHYRDASAQSNQQRRNDITSDTRLPLLSRFTDSAKQTLPSFDNHHGPTRPRLVRGPRGGGNQALEHRISKPKSVSLINRLED